MQEHLADRAPAPFISLDTFDVWANAHSHERPHQNETLELRNLGADLIGDAIAAIPHIRVVQSRCNCALWVVREDGQITGFNVFVPLSHTGVLALERGELDATNIPTDWIAAEGERCFGVYHWGFGGATHHARRTIMLACVDALQSVFAPIPVYCRAATEDGARAIESLGLEARNDLAEGIFWSPASRRTAA